MAAVALVPNMLAANAAIAAPTGDVSVAGSGNGFVIEPDDNPMDWIWLLAQNTGGASATLTVLAGSYPSALSSSEGPVVATVPAGGASWVGPFDTSRLQQPDGSLLIETSAALTVTAFTMDERLV